MSVIGIKIKVKVTISQRVADNCATFLSLYSA